MSSAAILFRSDAQCVSVNMFVRLSHFVFLPLIYLSPSLPLKMLNIFSLPPCLAAPRPLPLPIPLPLPLPRFLYPLLFLFSLSLYTPLPPYFHTPILFTPPVILIKPQFGTVMGICTLTRRAKLLVLFKANLFCPWVIPVMFHCQFNTDNAMLHCREHS